MKLTFSRKGNATDRRKRVLARLKKQLVDGVKPATITETNWAGITTTKKQIVPLTDSDVTRIKKEIVTLESRI